MVNNYDIETNTTRIPEDSERGDAFGGYHVTVRDQPASGFVVSTMDESWIKLYRRVEQSAVWNMRPEYLKLWIYLLLRARRTPHTVNVSGHTIRLEIGDVWTSHERMAIDCRTTKRVVKSFVKWCSESDQIVIRKCPKGTHVSICKYEQLQQTGVQKVSAGCPPGVQKVTHTKNVKKKEEDYTITDTIDRGANSRPRSQDEATAYFVKIGSTAEEGATFWDHFESNGWKVGGKTAMKNWQSAARNWVRRNNTNQRTNNGKRSKGDRSLEAGTPQSLRRLFELERPGGGERIVPVALAQSNGGTSGIGAPNDDTGTHPKLPFR